MPSLVYGMQNIKELERAGIIYEKEDHCCSSGSCCDFGGDRDHLCPGTDTGADLTGKEAGQRL